MLKNWIENDSSILEQKGLDPQFIIEDIVSTSMKILGWA